MHLMAQMTSAGRVVGWLPCLPEDELSPQFCCVSKTLVALPGPAAGICLPCFPASYQLGLCWVGKSNLDSQASAGPEARWQQSHWATAKMLVGGEEALGGVGFPLAHFQLCLQAVERVWGSLQLPTTSQQLFCWGCS